MDKWKEGDYSMTHVYTVQLQTRIPKMPNFKGRQSDKIKIMDKLLSCKKSRLFNLIGWAGMGKSALIASVLDYICERALIRGGIIYFNAKTMSIVELFLRNFNSVLISENPLIFTFTMTRDQLNKNPFKTLD